jgi:hypothetical protein
MRQLIILCSTVGLLCGAVGCHSTGDHAKVHGRCDCEELGYGCHYEQYTGGAGHAMAPAPPAPQAEPLKALPKEVTPKDEK